MITSNFDETNITISTENMKIITNLIQRKLVILLNNDNDTQDPLQTILATSSYYNTADMNDTDFINNFNNNPMFKQMIMHHFNSIYGNRRFDENMFRILFNILKLSPNTQDTTSSASTFYRNALEHDAMGNSKKHKRRKSKRRKSKRRKSKRRKSKRRKNRVKNKAKGKSSTIKKTTTSNSIPRKTNFNFKSNKRNKKCYNNRTHAICGICFEKLGMPRSQKPKQIVELKCGHCFHKDCIKRWKKNCPFCRENIVFKNEYDEDDEDNEDNEDNRSDVYVRENLIALIREVFLNLDDARSFLVTHERDRKEFIKFFRINLHDLNIFNDYTTEADNFGKFNDLKNYLLDENNSEAKNNYIETGNVNDTAKF